MKIWGMWTWTLRATIDFPIYPEIVSVSSKNETVATSHWDGSVRVIIWVSEDIVFAYSRPESVSGSSEFPITDIEFSSDGMYLGAIQRWGKFKIWNTATWEIV